MNEQQIAELEAHDTDRTKIFPVWEENAESLRVFLAVSSQWRFASGLGGVTYLGLDYAACAALLAGRGIPASPKIWEDLQTMEASACTALNER
jgi:hypothetical protein